MEKGLYPFQKEAIDKIIQFFYSDTYSGRVILPTGVGKSVIITTAIQRLLRKDLSVKILIVCSCNEILQQYRKKLDQAIEISVFDSLLRENNGNIFLCSVQNLLCDTFYKIENDLFDLIIYEDVDYFYSNEMALFVKKSMKTKYLEITSHNNIESGSSSFSKLIYEYRLSEAFKGGILHQSLENSFITNFFIFLLKYLGYSDILRERKIDCNLQKYCVDVMAKKKNISYLFEVKTYRDSFVAFSLIEQAINQIECMKRNIGVQFHYVLVVNCIVDQNIKRKIYKERQIEIWDISNILYLIQSSSVLLSKLSNIMPYPVEGIEKHSLFSSQEIIMENVQHFGISYYHEFQKRLMACPTGKEEKASQEYQNICNDIILYLFSEEFLQRSSQHRTKDNMFQMDLLCSLKGTTEFWRFLIQFYHTKFVVFEYKNYSDLVLQNSIYITQKYLFSSALRNVAFVISRYGFHKNASFVAMGILKDENQLIIDLTDEDLLVMVALKERGEEPSDYLLDKVEKLLMSMSI